MQLDHLVGRIAEAIPSIDQHTTIQNHNRRTKEAYLQGAPTLTEPQLVSEFITWWRENHPEDFQGAITCTAEVCYPQSDSETCDLRIEASAKGSGDWAVEMKYLRLIGNNGNNNDYVLQKALSPYLKDRSLIHDAERLATSRFGCRCGVIVYGFDYPAASFDQCKEIGANLPGGRDCAKNLQRVIRSAHRHAKEYRLEPVIELIDSALRRQGLADSEPTIRRFEGANRHPCGMRGLVAGWEICPTTSTPQARRTVVNAQLSLDLT